MNKDLKLLTKIYEGTHIGSKSLNAILPKIESPILRRAIISQICEYDKINSDAKSQISSMGEKTSAPAFSSLMAITEAKINTTINPSSSHIAEMVIKGSNMGIISITKELNKSNQCQPNAYNLGRKLVKTEEDNIEKIKSFL